MKWLLGLDLRNRCGGPLQLARRLAAQEAEATSVTALHVIEGSQRSLLTAANLSGQIDDLARREMAKVIAREGAQDIIDAQELRGSGEPHDVLMEAALALEVDGILIGRAAPRGEDPLVRLGKVARRVLRALPVPTVVTPPDLTAESLGRGPVLVATEAQDDSHGAARFATRLAGALGVELVLVHVAPMPMGWGEQHLPEETLQYAWSQYGASAQRELERWAGVHGFQGHRSIIGGGWIPAEIERIATEEGASVIVCGSRRLDPVSRIFVNSVGSELAAQSRRPVAIVPNDYGQPPAVTPG